MRCLFYSIFLLLSSTGLAAQTLGGNAVFSFLKQPNAALASALGGVNISAISNDVGLAFQNPSLLQSQHHAQTNVSFHLLAGGIKNYSLTTGYHLDQVDATLGIGISYFNYGSIPQTDASGNELGMFKPNDFVLQLMGAKKYKERWRVGGTIKYMGSSYGTYKSSGVAVDAGVTYFDSSSKIQVSVVAKNMGVQLQTYDGAAGREELPFDLQAGLTKRLEKAPVQFSLTAHNLHRFNIYYNDTAFLASEGEDDFRNQKPVLQKMLSHLVLATQVFINEKVELSIGYNFLRRHDLNVLNAANGLNGLTLGGGLLLKDLQIRYATGFYQQNMFNHLSVNFSWK